MYVRLVKLQSSRKKKNGCRGPRGLVVKRRNVLDMGFWPTRKREGSCSTSYVLGTSTARDIEFVASVRFPN